MIGNPLILLLAAIVPMLVGALWYGPLFGNSWMKVNGFKEEDLRGGNMIVIFGLSFVLSIILALGISGLAIHQNSIMQLFVMHPDFEVAGSEVNTLYNSIMDNYSGRHRTFGHGAIHGAFGSVLLALPLIAINGLFERRGAKYIGIHFGYWVVTMALMGGIICQWM